MIDASEKLGLDPHTVKNEFEVWFFSFPWIADPQPPSIGWMVHVFRAGIVSGVMVNIRKPHRMHHFHAKEHFSAARNPIQDPWLGARLRCQTNEETVRGWAVIRAG
jgi:hypothetical protein